MDLAAWCAERGVPTVEVGDASWVAGEVPAGLQAVVAALLPRATVRVAQSLLRVPGARATVEVETEGERASFSIRPGQPVDWPEIADQLSRLRADGRLVGFDGGIAFAGWDVLAAWPSPDTGIAKWVAYARAVAIVGDGRAVFAPGDAASMLDALVDGSRAVCGLVAPWADVEVTELDDGVELQAPCRDLRAEDLAEVLGALDEILGTNAEIVAVEAVFVAGEEHPLTLDLGDPGADNLLVSCTPEERASLEAAGLRLGLPPHVDDVELEGRPHRVRRPRRTPAGKAIGGTLVTPAHLGGFEVPAGAVVWAGSGSRPTKAVLSSTFALGPIRVAPGAQILLARPPRVVGALVEALQLPIGTLEAGDEIMSTADGLVFFVRPSGRRLLDGAWVAPGSDVFLRQREQGRPIG